MVMGKSFPREKEGKKFYKSKMSPVMVLMLLILIIWASILLFCLIWAFISTFKENYFDFRNNMFGLPKEWVFDNYLLVWKEFYVQIGTKPIFVEQLFLHSVWFVLSCAFTSTFVPMITAYACAKFPNWISSKIFYTTVILCMVIPIVGSQASELDMLIKLGLYNTLFVGPFCKSSFLGMYFIMFYGIFKNQAKEYQEAAFIDGANQFQVMFKISLPLVLNVWSIMFVLNIIGFWNDYSFPMLYMPKYPTVTFGLYQFSQSMDTDKSSIVVQFAAAFVTMLPVMLVFIIFRNKLIGKINVNSGIKG